MKTLTLPFKNESSQPIRLYLEPYAESYLVQPGQKVVVNAVCSIYAPGLEFVVGYDGSVITIYAPGAPDVLVDAYVTSNRTKLIAEPDE